MHRGNGSVLPLFPPTEQVTSCFREKVSSVALLCVKFKLRSLVTTKKSCMNSTPNDVPAWANGLSKSGRKVANSTVIRLVAGMELTGPLK